MNWIDYVILGVIFVSAFLSGIRGCIRELLAFVIWGGGFVLSCRYYEHGVPWFSFIPQIQVRGYLAFGSFFLGCLFIGSILSMAVDSLIKKTGFSSTNSLLGMFFGLFRGMFLVTVLIFSAQNFTQISAVTAWQESILIPHFRQLAEYGWLLYQEHIQPGLGNLLKEFHL